MQSVKAESSISVIDSGNTILSNVAKPENKKPGTFNIPSSNVTVLIPES